MPSDNHEVAADVIVVGAGPTGLMTTLLLAQYGHSVVLVEKWPETYPLPRAVGMAHDTMRAMQSAEAIEAVLPNLIFTPEGSMGDETRSATGEFLDVIPYTSTTVSGWPERAIFHQPSVEQTLDAQVRATPHVDVRRGWTATSVEQTPDGVTVTATPSYEQDPGTSAVAVSSDTGTLRVTGQYVVGADGANSVVREAVGGEITDLGVSYDWLVVDVLPKTELTIDPTLGQILGPPRGVTLAPGGPGRRRWEFQVLPGEDPKQLATPESIWKLLTQWNVTPENADLERGVIYTFRSLWSNTWRRGRAVLAGDAAHLMPPWIGEGLNSGVRDAVAVAWQLDLVLRGIAPPELLDKYTSERVAHVKALTEVAVEIGKPFVITDPAEAEKRDDQMRAARDGETEPEHLPEWKLGPGTWREEDPKAGVLGVQGNVTLDDAQGRFDDVVARRCFVLMGRKDDPGQFLSADQRKMWDTIGGVIVNFGPGSKLTDVEGTYEAWFADKGADVVIFRPDFYVAATGKDVADSGELVADVLARITSG